MKVFIYRCGEGHTFEREGYYHQFDQAQKCARLMCPSPAFMIVDQMAKMMTSTPHVESDAYMQHNVTYTAENSIIKQQPNDHANQCHCDACRGHRKRAKVTGVAEPMRKNRRVAKEVRA
jgi:hypothetical protein